jgi:hypothetical protein
VKIGAIMSSIKREFYDVEEAANVLGISVTDLWHLIEVEKIGASFRKVIAQVTYGTEQLHSMLASHAYLMQSSDACKVAAKGSTLIKNAYLPLLEPMEISIFNGEKEVGFLDTYEYLLDAEIEIQKSDIVITQISIEKYLKVFGDSNALTNKTLSSRTENNYLRLILTLANNIEGFNPKKPYEAAKLIIDATDIDISQQTISDYIKKAYEIECQKRD